MGILFIDISSKGNNIKYIDKFFYYINKTYKNKTDLYAICNQIYTPYELKKTIKPQIKCLKKYKFKDINLILLNKKSKNKLKNFFIYLLNRIKIKNVSISIEEVLKKGLDYSSYFLKLDIDDIIYFSSNHKILNILKKNPPNKIFLDTTSTKFSNRYAQSINIFKKFKEITSLYNWVNVEGSSIVNFKEITNKDIFNAHFNDISNKKYLSLRNKNFYFFRLMKKIFNISPTFILFKKDLRSTFLLWPENKNYKDVKNEILELAKTKNSLLFEIDRSVLVKEINELRNKYNLLKIKSNFINNFEDETRSITKGITISKENILYSYLKDTNLLNKELKNIDNKIQNYFRKMNINFLNISGINIRTSFPNQNKLAHTLKWHNDFNGWFILKAFIPLDIHEESFLEYKDSTHRSNPFYTRNNATNAATIKKFKSKLISRSNISFVNTSCIHRENKKTKESDTLIITYLTHPDYNNSPPDFKFYKN